MQNQRGFANMIVLVIFLFTMGGTVLYFKNFPLEKLPAGEKQAVTITEEVANKNQPNAANAHDS